MEHLDILDIVTTLLGLLYIWFEYRASIWLWLVGVIMPAFDIVLYWQHGLYGDAGMAVYYTLAGLYGYAVWHYAQKYKKDEGRLSKKGDLPITHMPKRLYLPMTLFFIIAWAITWYVLKVYTNSNVPILDGFTNALSIVGMLALARKYIEQWLFWIVVDIVCCYLYVTKGLPFKAMLYGLYIVIAVAGYFRWKKESISKKSSNFAVKS